MILKEHTYWFWVWYYSRGGILSFQRGDEINSIPNFPLQPVFNFSITRLINDIFRSNHSLDGAAQGWTLMEPHWSPQARLSLLIKDALLRDRLQKMDLNRDISITSSFPSFWNYKQNIGIPWKPPLIECSHPNEVISLHNRMEMKFRKIHVDVMYMRANKAPLTAHPIMWYSWWGGVAVRRGIVGGKVEAGA